jgi:hypothetical protein
MVALCSRLLRDEFDDGPKHQSRKSLSKRASPSNTILTVHSICIELLAKHPLAVPTPANAEDGGGGPHGYQLRKAERLLESTLDGATVCHGRAGLCPAPCRRPIEIPGLIEDHGNCRVEAIAAALEAVEHFLFPAGSGGQSE